MISLENVDARKFTIANFGHPVSKSWLRPCLQYVSSCPYLWQMMVVSLLVFWRLDGGLGMSLCRTMLPLPQVPEHEHAIRNVTRQREEAERLERKKHRHNNNNNNLYLKRVTQSNGKDLS